MTAALAGIRRRPRDSRPDRPLEAAGWWVLSLVLLAAVWEIVARLWNVPFLPPFTQVVKRFFELIGEPRLYKSLGQSLSNLAIGLLISVVLGVLLGALMGVSRRATAFLDIYVTILLATPSLVFAPVLFALFGVGRAVLVTLVVLFALVYIIMNTADGMRAVSAAYQDMAKVFNASGWQVFRKIIVPAAVPMIMTGFLIAVPRAVKGMITGEMFLAAVGLGAIVISAGKQFDATTVLAMLMLIVLLAFILLGLFSVLEKRVRAWLPQPTAGR